MLEGFHLRVSQIVLRAIEPYGFALGGGYALQAHGIIDRPSKDIDSYAPHTDEKLFNDAEVAVREALEVEGLSVIPGYSDSWFRALQVFDPAGEEAVVVDLGYDYRENEPVVIADLGPVLDIQDLITGKVRALFDRMAARDYIDIDAILRTGRWSPSDLLEALQHIRPEVTSEVLREILRSADTVDTEDYEGYHLSKEDSEQLVERLNAAAAELIS